MIRTLALALFAALSLAACNTMHGAGEDISSAGHAVSSTATDTQQKM